MSKIKKYIIGFFTLVGGILFAFLSGRSAGRKDEKFKNIKSKSKQITKNIKNTEKTKKSIQKSLKSKQKALNELKGKGYKKKDVGANEASNYLKKYLKNKK
tara:strand:- start:244 stop:546 length:303 start_codon:yes stop_codon:yes gene_type:complete